MKLEGKFILFILIVTLSSCGPKISRVIIDNSYTSKKNEQIIVVEVDEELINDSNYLGKVEYGQRFFPKDCSFKEIRKKAILEAQSVGANVVRIIEEQFNDNGEDCYRMKCELYHHSSDVINELQLNETKNNDPSRKEYKDAQDISVIELYASDSISINRKSLINTIYLSRIGWVLGSETDNERYEILRTRAIDSLLNYEGNILRICSFTGGMRVEFHKLDDITFNSIERQIKYFDNKQQKILKEHPLSKEKLKYNDLTPKPPEEQFWFTIPRDSTIENRIEIGIYGGSDILAGFNLHNNIEVHILNTSFGKISISNKVGIMLVAAGYGLYYDSPGLKLSIPITKFWFTIIYSKEFIRYSGDIGNSQRTDVIDKRIDIGLKMYKPKDLSFEIYYPLRLDKEVIDWYTGGIVVGVNKRF